MNLTVLYRKSQIKRISNYLFRNVVYLDPHIPWKAFGINMILIKKIKRKEITDIRLLMVLEELIKFIRKHYEELEKYNEG